MPTDWTTADGWAKRSEAEDHARKLRKEHPEYTIRVRHGGSAFGGGKWLVEYKAKGE